MRSWVKSNLAWLAGLIFLALILSSATALGAISTSVTSPAGPQPTGLDRRIMTPGSNPTDSLRVALPLIFGGSRGVGFSLRFYGHGVNDIDRVKIQIDAPAVPADIGAGDFTVEFWLKANPGENAGVATCDVNDGWITGNIVLDRDIWGSGDYGDYGIALSGGRVAFGVNHFVNGGNSICGATNVADGVWHHIAVTRRASDGALRIYVDGQLDGQGAGPSGNLSYRDGRSTAYPNDPFLVVAAEKHDAGSEYPSFSGWLDELRLSDVVRYTANFVRPSAPFSADSNTMALYHFDEGPAGPCTGTVLDSSGADGGPSNGQCRHGGSALLGPVYSADTPFAVGSPTVTPTASRTAMASRTPTVTPSAPTAVEWSQFAHDAQHTGYTDQVVSTPWRWKWAWNGPDASGQVSASKFRLPRNSQPVTGGGRVYVAAGSRGVYALNNANGSVIWNSTPGGDINSTPAYDATTGALFVVSSNGTLYKLDAATGATLGQFATGAGSPLPLPPAVLADRILFAMGSRVYALDKATLAQLWVYDVGSAVHTPPAYSPSRDRVIVASQDLYVHAVNNSDGTRAWRVKPTVRSGGNPGENNDALAEVANGWPVIAEGHGYVLVKLRLDWQALWDLSWPTDNAAMRSYLQSRPQYQTLFVLDLDDGTVPFIANIGHGGFGDGGYLPMGPQPVVRRLPGGQEVVYTVIRGGGDDGREDSHPGEMVLDDSTVPGLLPGYVRWIDEMGFTNAAMFFPTDEQPYVTMAGDHLFYAHWEAGAAYIITDRSGGRGTHVSPIAVALAPAIVTSQDDPSCPFSASHYCSGGLQNTRNYPSGFYIYHGQGAVYDRYWSEYASWVVSNDTIYFVSTDGALVALEHGSPMATLVSGSPEQAPSRSAGTAAASGSADTGAIVPYKRAAVYAGQHRIVEGVVRFVFNNRQAVYLGFQNPHQGAFKVRIMREHWGNFAAAPETLYRVGDRLRVSGVIGWYQGDPVIYARTPAQIEIVRP